MIGTIPSSTKLGTIFNEFEIIFIQLISKIALMPKRCFSFWDQISSFSKVLSLFQTRI